VQLFSKKKLKQSAYLIAIMLGLPLTGLLVLGIDGEHHFSTLPYFTKEGSMDSWNPDAKRVMSFALTNQDGHAFHSDSLAGKVWLAAFYSTEADHVAQMTKQLLWPNFRYRDEDGGVRTNTNLVVRVIPVQGSSRLASSQQGLHFSKARPPSSRTR
jgi:hypothetical protein